MLCPISTQPFSSIVTAEHGVALQAFNAETQTGHRLEDSAQLAMIGGCGLEGESRCVLQMKESKRLLVC